MKKRHLFFLFLTVIYSASGLTGHAQITIDTVKVGPQPIPVSEINALSQEVYSLITTIDANLSDNSEIITLQEDFKTLSHEIDSVIRDIDTAKIELPKVNSLSILLNGYLNQFDNFENTLNKRTEKLEEYRVTIRESNALWDLTLQTAKENMAASTVIQNLNAVIQSLTATDKNVVKQIDAVFRIHNALAEMEALIHQSLQELTALKTGYSQKIFKIDSPPIWAMKRDSVQSAKISSEFLENWKTTGRDLGRHINQNLELVIIHGVIIIILFIVIFILRKKQEKLIQYSDQKELWLLFKNPVALTLLLGILVFAPPYKQTPEFLIDLLLLFVYLIVLRLLFPLISVRVKPAFLLLGLFLILNTVFYFVSQVQLPGRLVMLVESIISIAIIIRLIAIGFKGFNFFNQQSAKWMLFFLPVALLFYGFSIITNLLGASSFTLFILNGTINAIALGIIVFAGVMALSGLTSVLLQNPKAKAAYIIKEHASILEQRIKTIIQLIFYFLWIKYVIEGFGVWDPFLVWFNGALDYKITLGTLSFETRGILAFIITLIITWWLAKLIRLILEKELFQRMTLPRGIPGTISSTTYYFILAIGFFIALRQTGVELSQISIIIGALGVGIGFGLQNVVSNFVSGIILVFERPIQEGDVVEVNNLLGVVKSIGIRSSRIRTYDGFEVIVPNNNLTSNEVINWTLTDTKRRVTIEVGVAYGTDPRTVSQLLVKVAKAYPKTLKDPDPLPIFIGFGDSSLNFKIHFWTYFEDSYVAKSEVAMDINDALLKEGIEIPFPQRVITMKDGEKKG